MLFMDSLENEVFAENWSSIRRIYNFHVREHILKKPHGAGVGHFHDKKKLRDVLKLLFELVSNLVTQFLKPFFARCTRGVFDLKTSTYLEIRFFKGHLKCHQVSSFT